MGLLDLVVTVIAVSASGALAPGPLFFYTLMEGTSKGVKAGLNASVGHTMVEFPYVVAIAIGLEAIVTAATARFWISLLGGAVLILFGIFQLYSLRTIPQWSGRESESAFARNAVIMGAIFTALNPFFLLWWVTIGTKLVFEALLFASLVGVVVMYLAHVWMDYAFLGLSAYFARRGVNVIGSRGYRLLLALFSVILIYFGMNFLTSAFRV